MAYSAYVSEIFESLEGEGPCAGMATLFIRFFGCNLKCPGFNNHADTPKTVQMFAKEALDTEGYVSGGCDSIYSWHPSFKNKRRKVTSREIADTITQGFVARRFSRVSFTGGEPMLNQDFIADVLQSVLHAYDNEEEERLHGLQIDGLVNGNQILINIETNGTIPLKENLMDMASVEFGDYTDLPITFTVSPKLHNSGEEEIARRPYLLIENSDFFDDYPPIIKAVVADEAGVRELIHILDQTHRTSPRHHIYLMAEAATPEQLAVNGPKVAALAKSQGWSYSNRLHLTLYGNAPGT
jgi:organic radical activating enzyme